MSPYGVYFTFSIVSCCIIDGTMLHFAWKLLHPSGACGAHSPALFREGTYQIRGVKGNIQVRAPACATFDGS